MKKNEANLVILREMINNENVNVYVDSNGRIIVDGDINIYDTKYDKFPVKIYQVNGTINWYGEMSGKTHGSLASLENFPDIITGSVNIFKNYKLKSLKGCPREIGGSLICDHCNINDISGIATSIKKHFIASYNPIDNVSILEKTYVGGNIELIETPWVDKHETLKLPNDTSIIIISETAGIF